MNKHVIYTDRPFPAHIFKVTHPLRQVKLDHSDVAETHRQHAPHYMSVLKEKQHAKRA